MQTMHLYQQLTHAWAPGYRHMERDRYLGDVRVLAPNRREAPTGDFSDGGSIQFRVAVPTEMRKRVTVEVLREVLHETFTYSNCRHEYDCCGCKSAYARVRRASTKNPIASHTACVLIRAHVRVRVARLC